MTDLLETPDKLPADVIKRWINSSEIVTGVVVIRHASAFPIL